MTRKQALERMSAPVIAWLIENGYVLDMCGSFHMARGWDSHMPFAYQQALRVLPKNTMVPAMQDKPKIMRERL